MRRNLIAVVDAVHDRKHGAAQQKRHQKDGRTPTGSMGVSQTHEFQVRSNEACGSDGSYLKSNTNRMRQVPIR